MPILACWEYSEHNLNKLNFGNFEVPVLSQDKTFS